MQAAPMQTNEGANDSAKAALPSDGFVRLKLILKLIPVSHTQLWRMVNAGTFPKPIKLSDNVTVWEANAVRKYINDLVATN